MRGAAGGAQTPGTVPAPSAVVRTCQREEFLLTTGCSGTEVRGKRRGPSPLAPARCSPPPDPRAAVPALCSPCDAAHDRSIHTTVVAQILAQACFASDGEKNLCSQQLFETVDATVTPDFCYKSFEKVRPRSAIAGRVQ